MFDKIPLVALCSRNANIGVVFVVSNYCFKGTELIRILFKQRTDLQERA